MEVYHVRKKHAPLTMVAVCLFFFFRSPWNGSLPVNSRLVGESNHMIWRFPTMGGTPIAGWFISWKIHEDPKIEWMI